MISTLIIKYLNEEATEQEVDLVFKWIEASETNKKQFIALKKTWAMSQFSDIEKSNTWFEIQKITHKNKTFKAASLLKYAAILILLVSLGAFIWSLKEQQFSKTESIVLEIEETNTKLNLDKDGPIIESKLSALITKQNENEMIYKSGFSSQPIAYHTLKIPYAKIFKLTLSDGTLVYLNAGSRLKYPKQFSSNENRKVYLEGEAFFKVQKNEKQPFIVEANNTNVTVLGTAFNVNTSKLKNQTTCVLVEGSVKLTNSVNNVILRPNEKASWNTVSNSFEVNTVNTKLYASWIYGELIFEDTSFSEISNKLTQFYNIEINNQSNLLKSQTFSGTISLKNSSIENILDLLSIDTPFHYTKENNRIIIKNNKP